MNRNRQTGATVHKHEGNNYANRALTHALGLRGGERPNWSCCHIWGVDDASFSTTNLIVQDARFYSCVANMVMLPTPLKAFTDVMPEVKAMLRACSLNTYGWRCEHEAVATFDAIAPALDPAYPSSWPKSVGQGLPAGTIALTHAIRFDANRRLATIRRDMERAGPHYPREQVRAVLEFWKIKL